MAANARNKLAEICAVKGRPANNPWIVDIGQGDELYEYGSAETGVITFHKFIESFPQERLPVLSATAKMRQAASNLYHSLPGLEGMNLKRIVSERLAETDLGKILPERLKKTREEQWLN